MSTTWRPSKRLGSAGFVTAPYGGRAIGGIFAKGSSFIITESDDAAVSASTQMANRWSRGLDPCG